ncbi:cytochrome P450 [Melanomma pulvis-pyrius CBS 109.77]|uniref:Cytochrome P450 n=1 Tax=Melanomma pulvis-pyrius CBS 109.77 TaxID=1314802 RepID=A0A6A6X9P6_9PLEO|nr:cytochrome P450 [Melanomma pulvis-pyrius CBS 109.77]
MDLAWSQAILCILLPPVCIYVFFVQLHWKSWKYLSSGRDMMMAMADQCGDAAFSVPIPGNRLHLFTSKRHWDELNSTSLDVLSNHAWSKDMLQPKAAFGYDWSDRRNEEGMPIVRAIRTISNQFSILRPECVRILEQDFNQAMESNPSGKNAIGRVPLWPTIQFSLARITTLMICGEDVANDPEFMERSVKFLDEAGKVAEATKILPSFISPVVKMLIQGRNLNRDYVYATIANKTEEFRRAKAASEDTKELPKTILNAFMETVPDDWPTTRVVHIVNTLWYSASQGITVLAAHLIQDIYTHESHIRDLQQECRGVLDDADSDMSKLPLLEAFLMESMRTKCFQSTTIHRVALGKPYTFSDGYSVPAGEILSFLQHKVYSDDTLYAEARNFHPARFQGSGRAATDMPGMEWAFWGNSKLAW